MTTKLKKGDSEHAASTESAAAHQPVIAGWANVKPNGLILGWAANSSDSNMALSVELYIDGEKIASGIADQQHNAKGTIIQQGYRFVIPWIFEDGVEHTYCVLAGEEKVRLRQPEEHFLRKPQVKGSAEIVSGSVAGWIWTDNRPLDRYRVSLEIDGIIVGSAFADSYILSAPTDEKRCGYEIPIPARFWDGKKHGYALYAEGFEQSFSRPGAEFALSPPKILGEYFIDMKSIVGWAVNQENTKTSVDLQIYIDDELVGTALASAERPEVSLKTWKTGASGHGFSYKIPAFYFDDTEHSVSVRPSQETGEIVPLANKVFLRKPVPETVSIPGTKNSLLIDKTVYLDECETIYDVVFVLNINSQGWILEKICRQIETTLDLRCHFVFSELNSKITGWLPRARAYFFSHYKLLQGAANTSDAVASALRYVWFTHPVFNEHMSRDELFGVLNSATHIFTANSKHRHSLEFVGLPANRISTPIGGADPNLFTSTPRNTRTVGLVGAYYDRKNPDLILEIVKLMSDVEFRLIGPSEDEVQNARLLWSNWSRFGELTSCKNFTYIEAPYIEFPAQYASFDVYLSLSNLEGGPIPLVEAMMADRVPVVTDTGFARDLIRDGENGYVIPVDVEARALRDIITKALHFEGNIRDSVVRHSWSEFGRSVSEIIAPTLSADNPLVFFEGAPASIYLRGGWYSVGRFGAELRGESGSIKVKVTEDFSNLAVECQVAGGSSSLLSILINGVETIELTLTDGINSFSIPAHVLVTDLSRLNIEFRRKNFEGSTFYLRKLQVS